MSDINQTRKAGTLYDHPEFRVTLRDKAVWTLGKWGFEALHTGNAAIRVATRNRWCPLYGPMEGKAWRCYLWCASFAWPYDEWRAGRIP